METRSAWANALTSDHLTRKSSTVLDRNVEVAAQTGACVLLTGPREAAEAVAYRIHNLSHWRYGPFNVVDCGWNEAAVERALFGTFGSGGRRGVVQHFQRRYQQGGTVLLQEVGRLSTDFQARLAERLVAMRSNWSNGWSRRVIASTSQPLLERVNDGTFDHCLYYRLNVIHLCLE